MLRPALTTLGHKRKASSMTIEGGQQEASTPIPSATSNNLVNPYSRSDSESHLPVPSSAPSCAPSCAPSGGDAENWQPDGHGAYVSHAASDMGTKYQWHRNQNVGSVSNRANGDKHIIKGCQTCQGCPALVRASSYYELCPRLPLILIFFLSTFVSNFTAQADCPPRRDSACLRQGRTYRHRHTVDTWT